MCGQKQFHHQTQTVDKTKQKLDKQIPLLTWKPFKLINLI